MRRDIVVSGVIISVVVAALVLVVGLCLIYAQRKLPPPPPAPVTVVPTTVSATGVDGQVFVKLVRGVDRLSGLRVRILPISARAVYNKRVDENNSLKADLRRKTQSLASINGLVRELKEKKTRADETRAAVDHALEAYRKFSAVYEDFDRHGYNQFSFVDPRDNSHKALAYDPQRTTWEGYLSDCRSQLMDIRNDLNEACARAMNEQTEAHRGFSDKMLSEALEKQRSEEADSIWIRQRITDEAEIAREIMENSKPVADLVCDDLGRFKADLSLGAYVVASTYQDPVSLIRTSWLVPFDVVDQGRASVSLSQSNSVPVKKGDGM
jgi:hypothetical protein